MATFIILLIFVGGPLAVAGFVIFAAVNRANQRNKIARAAEKYLNA